jgi:hypothetical protein
MYMQCLYIYVYVHCMLQYHFLYNIIIIDIYMIVYLYMIPYKQRQQCFLQDITMIKEYKKGVLRIPLGQGQSTS